MFFLSSDAPAGLPTPHVALVCMHVIGTVLKMLTRHEITWVELTFSVFTVNALLSVEPGSKCSASSNQDNRNEQMKFCHRSLQTGRACRGGADDDGLI